ncbi:MAG: hypothetical protein SGJ09_07420 [Phycisphaerae bacterium]|nr:hypothetical protein [Phycisphaerae bacterium]
MVAKLAVVIIAIGAAFGALLVNRQQRIDAVAEIARSQLRMVEHRRTITRLQAAVADAVRPSELRVALGKLSVEGAVEWVAIPNRFSPMKQLPSRESAPPRLAASEPTLPAVPVKSSGAAGASGRNRAAKAALPASTKSDSHKSVRGG